MGLYYLRDYEILKIWPDLNLRLDYRNPFAPILIFRNAGYYIETLPFVSQKDFETVHKKYGRPPILQAKDVLDYIIQDYKTITLEDWVAEIRGFYKKYYRRDVTIYV